MPSNSVAITTKIRMIPMHTTRLFACWELACIVSRVSEIDSYNKQHTDRLDFAAHSNYTELALKELGVDAFPHVGKNTAMDINGKKIFPVVTGTFG